MSGQWPGQPIDLSQPTATAGAPQPVFTVPDHKAAGDAAAQAAQIEHTRLENERMRAELHPDDAVGIDPDLMHLTGPDFIAKLPPSDAAQVKALAEGRMAFPAGKAAASPYWQKRLAEVSQYDPEFDAVNYNARAATRRDFTSGTASKNIKALNTAIGHVGLLGSQISGTASHGGFPGATMLNAAENAIYRSAGSSGITKFEQTATGVASELTQVFRGSGGAEADVKRYLDELNSNASEEQKKAAIANIAALLKSRLDAINDQYVKGMGTTAQPLETLDAHAKEVLAKYLPTVDGGDDDGGSARKPEMAHGVPVGSEIKFGMDGDGPPTGFDHNEWLKTLGLNPDEEAEIAAFWNANRGNKNFTVPQAKKWFAERGFGSPTDADLAGAVRDARRGANFGGIDDSAAKAAYEAKLDAENQRRGFDPSSVDAGLGQFNQGATLANSDELTGALGAVGAGLQGENPVEAYTFNRDLERRQLEQSSEAMPKTSLALNLAGGLAAPIGMVGKGAKMAEYVKAGAKAGAVAGFGGGNGLVDSATGAVGGAAVGGAVGKLVGKGAEWLAARKVARGEKVIEAAGDVAPTPGMPQPGGVDTGGSLPAAPLTNTEQAEIATLAKKATGWGLGARAARKELARKAAANPEAKAAAERLGVDLPPDILSDDAQLQSLTGLARSEVGSEAETGWRATVANVANQSEQALADLGASPDLAQLSDDVLTRLNGTAKSLQRQAGKLRDEVTAAVPPGARVTASHLEQVVAKLIDDYGGIAEAKAAMTGPERELLKMLGEGEEAVKPTYARLNRLRSDIGDALDKNKGPWADVGRKELGDYYRALADDQLAAVEEIGGAELADKQRAANTLFKQMFDQRGEMQDLFGKNLEKGLAPLLKRSLTAGAKGDAKDLTLLLDRVPEDARGGAMLSAVMSLARSSASHGGFSFANYAKLYRGLRENAPVYARIAKAVGPGAEQVLRDLYAISNRMASGETKVLKTGKANQVLSSAMNAEGIVANVMSAAGDRASVVAGTAVGGTVAGPAGAVVGGSMAKSAKQALSGAGKSRLDKVHGLLTSPQFQETIERVAAGEDPATAAEGLWNTVAFHKFAKSVGAVKGASRRALLKSLVSTGAEKASAAVDMVPAAPTRAAADESQGEDRTTIRAAGQ